MLLASAGALMVMGSMNQIKGLHTKRGWFYFQPSKPKGGLRPVAIALGTKDLAEALGIMAEKRADLAEWQASRARTLEVVLPVYYAAKAHDAVSTRRQREVVLAGFKDILGNPRVDSITLEMIESWREHVRELGGVLPKPGKLGAVAGPVKEPVKGRSPTTLRSYTIVVRAFLNWAVEEGMIRSSPMRKMKRQVTVARTKVQDFLSEEEREILLAAEAPDYVRLILHLGFFAGLRDGEMLALSPRWIWVAEDWSRGTLTVQNQPIVFHDGAPGEWRPKVRELRVIPLHPRLLAFLKDYGLRAPWLLMPDKERWPGEGKNSKRFDAHKALYGLAKRTGVRHLNYHILRRSFATHLVMKGVALADVAGLLGDTLQVTQAHYAGYSPNQGNPLEVL